MYYKGLINRYREYLPVSDLDEMLGKQTIKQAQLIRR